MRVTKYSVCGCCLHVYVTVRNSKFDMWFEHPGHMQSSQMQYIYSIAVCMVQANTSCSFLSALGGPRGCSSTMWLTSHANCEWGSEIGAAGMLL